MRPLIAPLVTVAAVTLVTVATGCGSTQRNYRMPTNSPHAGQAAPARTPSSADSPTPLVLAGYQASPAKPEDFRASGVGKPTAAVSESDQRPLALPDFTRMALEQNPRLSQATWAVEAAKGNALQAGLYPNPTVRVTGDELGDRQGPSGIWTAGASQEIVTAGKLGLSQAAAGKQVDQATLSLVGERYRVLTEIRQNFFEVVLLQRRAEAIEGLVTLATQSQATANKLLAAKEVSRLDVLQLEVDLERYRADLEATTQAIPPAFRRLAASVGVPDLPLRPVLGSVEAAAPDYDLERTKAYVVGVHPEVRSAELGVERAQLLVRRAEAEPIPNLTVSSGFTRQGQNDSNDWNIGVSVPLPVWDKNQGNIAAAKAQVAQAAGGVARVRNDLVNRVATAFGVYAVARKRAERYKASILPRAEETYQLSSKAYQGGQFEYLRVLQAQRAVGEANLEYLRSLGELWRSASEIAGLMLEDEWPLVSAPPAAAPAQQGK
jgi:cobalt-zinc-cadmium efflux system outer membrane protein